MKLIASVATVTVAAVALSACSSNTRWEPSATYLPAQEVRPSPADLLPASKTARRSAKRAKPVTRKKQPSEMCGFAWCIPDFDTRQVHVVTVKNGELTTFAFPLGETVETQLFGSIGNAFDGEPVAACGGGRCRLAIKPVWLEHPGDIEVITSGDAYRFLLVPVKGNGFLRAVDISGTADDQPGAVADNRPEAVTPSGKFQKLTLVPLDGDNLPAGAPYNVWTDKHRMVVELPAEFPIPVFLAGQKGETVVQYATYRYVARDGRNVVAYATKRPITEAMLHYESGERVLITARPEMNGSAWKRAASLPDDLDQAAADPEPRRSPGVQPAMAQEEGSGVFGDEIDRIIQENNRKKKPIEAAPPEGIPVEEVI